MIKIKEYAEKHNISIQAVHQALNRKKNKERLEGHIHLIDGVKHLDDEAVAILDEVRSSQPVVILTDEREDLKQEVAFLKAQLNEAQKEVLKLQSDLIASNKEKLLLQDSMDDKVRSAEDRVKNDLQEKFNQERSMLNNELQEERTRKLTLMERFLGRKLSE